MRIRLSVKPMCGYCKIIRHKGHVMVTCLANPKHKQRQG